MLKYSNSQALPLSIRAMLLLFVAWIIVALNTAKAQDTEVIAKVSFTGNETYPDFILKNFIYTKQQNTFQRWLKKHSLNQVLNTEELRKDEIRLERYYQRRGFPLVVVESEINKKGKQTEILFIIKEGPPQRIQAFELRIEADSSNTARILDKEDFQRVLARHAYREGKRFESVLRSDVQADFQRPLRARGYAFARAEINTQLINDTSVVVTLMLKPGKYVRVGDLLVEGNQLMTDQQIIKESALKSGRVYEQRQIERAQRELFDHHLLRFATLSIQQSAKDSNEVNIKMNVRERQLRSLQLVGGIGVEERLRAQVNWTHRNVFDKAHQLTLETAASFIEQRVSASYLLPFVYNTQSSLVFSPFAQNVNEPGYRLQRAGISNTYIYRANRDFTATLTYNATRNQERLRNENISLPDSVQNFEIASLNAGVLYTRGYVKDQRGWVIRAGTELSGHLIEATYPFERLSVDVRHYKPAAWKGGQLAFKVEAGFIISEVAQDSLPRNLRFFLGGTSSVRGWNRQQLGPKTPSFDGDRFNGFIPLGGRSMVALSFEYRQDVPFIVKGLGIAAFIDGGNVWSGNPLLSKNPLRWGSGMGLRYASPIGPLRLDFGYQLNPSETDKGFFEGQRLTDARNWAIHFSLGQAF